MHSRTWIVCAVMLSVALTGCGFAEPGSGEVADVMKRVSVGMEAQKLDFWGASEIGVTLGSAVAEGEVLQVGLSELQVQAQQPPAMAALRLVGQMQLVSQVSDDDATLTVVNYIPRFRSDAGEILVVEPDEAYAIVENMESGADVVLGFTALIPSMGDDEGYVTPDPTIEELVIEINYGVDGESGVETAVFRVTLEQE
jgi:hypothetical protein